MAVRSMFDWRKARSEAWYNSKIVWTFEVGIPFQDEGRRLPLNEKRTHLENDYQKEVALLDSHLHVLLDLRYGITLYEANC